ncbi:hypothetical protein GCM10009304_10940 [Pseudomonas matsuisoli]|uniref:Uncharacterized protein n=1 Tax=Pseudomonas matsuisoli TaxID=1515666 RepID=A0A917PP31_9PSED|nr:hypothetical protein GCM10009304_10940 [Pseudomonas matsuisoli]
MESFSRAGGYLKCLAMTFVSTCAEKEITAVAHSQKDRTCQTAKNLDLAQGAGFFPDL